MSGGGEIASLFASIGAETSPFEAGLGRVKGGLSGVSSLLKAVPFVAVFAMAVTAASKYETSVAQLDAVLKSTKATTQQSTTIQAHWATATSLSTVEAGKLQEKLATATARMHDLQYAQSHSKHFSEGQALALSRASAAVADLSAQLGKGTAAQKVWVDGVQRGAVVEQMSRNALLGLADSLSRVTRYSREDVISVESMALTFTSIGANIFPQVTEAALDMSTALNQGTKQSMIQLGKALNDPIRGMTALRRVGIMFTDSQAAMILRLSKTGNLLEAQKMILAEITKEFGGSARAAGQTFAGQLDILNNSINTMMVSIGNALLPTINSLVGVMVSAVQGMEDWDPAFVQIAAAAGLLTLALSPLGLAIVGIMAPIIAVIGVVALLKKAWDDNFLGIRGAVEKALAAAKPAIEELKKVVAGFMQVLNGGQSQQDVNALNKRHGEDTGQKADTSSFGDRLAKAFETEGPKVAAALSNVLGTIADSLAKSAGDAFGKLGTAIANSIKKGITDGLNKASDDLTKALNDLASGMGLQGTGSNSWIAPDGKSGGGGALSGSGGGGSGSGSGGAKRGGGRMLPGKQGANLGDNGPSDDPLGLKAGIMASVAAAVAWLQSVGTPKLTVAIGGALTEGVAALKAAAPEITTAIQDAMALANAWLTGSGVPATVAIFKALGTAAGGQLAGVGAPMITSVIGALLRIAAIFEQLPFGVGQGIANGLRNAASARASGGSVGSSGLYLVGEKGPELFAPGQSGTIIPNRALTGGGGGGGGNVVQVNGPISVYGVQNPEAFFDEMKKVAKRRNLAVASSMGA